MNNQYDDIHFLEKKIGKNILSNKILNINGKIIPNFYLDYYNNILTPDMVIFELNHLIDKLFLSKNKELTYYETPYFKINNDIVFDCGGNMGLFAAAVAERSKEVYCFEPMSLIRKNLEKTQALYQNIHIIPMGFWNENTHLFLYQKDNPGASHVDNLDQNPVNRILYKENCQMITLDSFIDDTGIIPTFIKVDIEGSEIQFLQGAINCLKKYKPKLSLVLHYSDDKTVNYVKDLLSKYNYQYQLISTSDGILVLGE